MTSTSTWVGIVIGWFGSYGFIRTDHPGPDVFVRERLLRRGDRVRFTPVPNPRHPGQAMALDVEVIGEVPNHVVDRLLLQRRRAA